jgi:predicted RecB family nuclease
MTNREDGPWQHAKREIAAALEELTLLWYVGPTGRRAAHEAGVFRWRDPACTPAVVDLTGPKRTETLERILDVNRSSGTPPVQPDRVSAVEAEWRPFRKVEFYVDFETATDLADDFLKIPERGGQPLVFIIGCGHLENERWQFRQFVAEDLTEPSEALSINNWLEHMTEVYRRIDPQDGPSTVFHWAHHEQSTFETAYNSAKARHPNEGWPTPRFFDLHMRVVREEPVVVRGALGFGLKGIGQALHRHGLIATHWQDGPTDGLGAMVGSWWCYKEAKRQNVPVTALNLMQEIIRYNEVDCRVMMEILQYLRSHH